MTLTIRWSVFLFNRLKIDAIERIDSGNCSEDCSDRIPSDMMDFRHWGSSSRQDTVGSVDQLEQFHTSDRKNNSVDPDSLDKTLDNRLETTRRVKSQLDDDECYLVDTDLSSAD